MTDGHRAKSGRWFSARWWAGHWDLRDPDDGEYTDVAHLGAGKASKREARFQRRMRLERERQDRAHAAKQRKAAGGRRESLREDVRLAQHDQTLRAERQAMGYKAETAGFYGSSKVAQAEHSERRLTTAQADQEARRQAEAEREERDAWRRQKAAEHAWFKDRSKKKGQAA